MKSQKNSISWAHALVQAWFINKFGTATEPQELGWPPILAGKTTLLSAPTGSGKTLAAFLACLDKLVRQALSHKLPDETEVLYISPLKALSNDIQKNLMQPLAEIAELAKKQGLPMMTIRVAVRTGDTLAHERQAMLKKPPHILVTTPESLYILLTAKKSRDMLRTVHTVIIDEIHAIADDKRGAHLSLSLERLEQLTDQRLVRIGLSATQKPIERVAEFLTGNGRKNPVIINIGYKRDLDIAIEVPGMELGPVASNEMWDEIYDRITALANENRSTLVFVNTRKLAERVAHHLAERLGKDQVIAHHGSLSRKIRLTAETKLKNGELKALVATASLELGIDIGNVDLVCQIGSPRAIAVGLQRIGRAGHWRGAISKGRFFATTRDELLECASLVYAIHKNDLDELIIPKEPLDILSQQIVAMCAAEDWDAEKLFTQVKKAYPYRDLSRVTFNTIIHMLAEGVAGARGRYGAYLFHDKVNGMIKARRNARLTAITSGGAIPENGLFTVIAEPNGVMVGTLDEDFAVESSRGDIILLGTTSWCIRRIEGTKGKVFVEDAHGAPPSVPFWRGEAPGRSNALSYYVSELRKIINDKLPAEKSAVITWLKTYCGLNDAGAEQLVDYIELGRAVLGTVPTQTTIIAERFFDESGGMQLIIHAPFGARINKAWGLALRKKFCRSFNFELQAQATDDGLNIALTEQHSFPLADVFHFLKPETLKDVLVQAVLQSPLFTTRWRWTATRSLALPRFRGGKKIPPNILRMLSDDLLAAVFPDAAACQDNLAGRDINLPDHPLINETMKDALNEALDLAGITEVIKNVLNGKINCIAVDSASPSVFCHEILNANPYAYLDDAPLEERRARAVTMRRMLPQTLLAEVGRLDQSILQEVTQQTWPDVRSADELHDVLQTLIALPIDFMGNKACFGKWQPFFQELLSQGRVGIANDKEKKFWLATEKVSTFKLIFPHSLLEQNLKTFAANINTREDAIIEMVRGWLQQLGPVTTKELSTLFNLPSQEIEQALLKLEISGQILRGQFRNRDETEWCERRILARIHRGSVAKLRKEIEPVTASQFFLWLMRWQHVAPQTQLQGEHGLFEIIKQLQGFEIPAKLWERQIFAKRVQYYDGQMLDQLCLSGRVGWGRVSPHPATTFVAIDTAVKQKRVIPTSIVPITFFVREDCDWLIPHEFNPEDLKVLSHTAKKIYNFLKQRGASFFNEIVNRVDALKSEIETGLWELVAVGFVTADGFDNLRALIDPKRRRDRRGHKILRQSVGRWSLLYTDENNDKEVRTLACAKLLLKRYGVVFRDLLVREKMLPTWRELLIALRRLEDQGEIRGGRFVSGFLGEQFALPNAVESLRAMRKLPYQAQAISIAAVDPLNLTGIILPGEKTPAISGKKITINDECIFPKILQNEKLI